MWIVLLIAALAGLWLLRQFAYHIPHENSHWSVFARAPLTMREQFLYHRLSVMYPEHIILAQVALSQIIDVSPGTPNRQAIRIRPLIRVFPAGVHLARVLPGNRPRG